MKTSPANKRAALQPAANIPDSRGALWDGRETAISAASVLHCDVEISTLSPIGLLRFVKIALTMALSCHSDRRMARAGEINVTDLIQATAFRRAQRLACSCITFTSSSPEHPLPIDQRLIVPWVTPRAAAKAVWLGYFFSRARIICWSMVHGFYASLHNFTSPPCINLCMQAYRGLHS